MAPSREKQSTARLMSPDLQLGPRPSGDEGKQSSSSYLVPNDELVYRPDKLSTPGFGMRLLCFALMRFAVLRLFASAGYRRKHEEFQDDL